MMLKYNQETVLVCMYSKPKFRRQPPVIPFFILRGPFNQLQTPAPQLLNSLLYFFSFNVYPYLKATICLLPFQATCFWKWTTKQVFQLWIAEGKTNSTFILQVFSEILNCKIWKAKQSKHSWVKPLRNAIPRKTKRKNILTLYIPSKLYPSNICLDIIKTKEVLMLSLKFSVLQNTYMQ